MNNPLKNLEQKLGLPPLEKVLDLASGEQGKKINALLGRLERLSKDKESLELAVSLFNMVERTNSSGSLDKLIELTRELNQLTKGKQAQRLLQRLEKLDQLADSLLKD